MFEPQIDQPAQRPIRQTNRPVHVFGLWEGGAIPPTWELNPQPACSEVTQVQTIANDQPCHKKKKKETLENQNHCLPTCGMFTFTPVHESSNMFGSCKLPSSNTRKTMMQQLKSTISIMNQNIQAVMAFTGSECQFRLIILRADSEPWKQIRLSLCVHNEDILHNSCVPLPTTATAPL